MDREKTNAEVLWDPGRLDTSQLIPHHTLRSHIEKARRFSKYQKRTWFCFAKYPCRSPPSLPPPADSIRLAQDRHSARQIGRLRNASEKLRTSGCGQNCARK